MTMTEAIQTNLDGFALLAPEITVTVALVVLVLISMLTSGRKARVFASVVSVVGLVLAGWSLLSMSVNAPVEQAFFGLLAVDPFSILIKILVLTGTLLAAILVWDNDEIPDARSAEFHVLLLTAFLGMSFISGAYHLLMVYFALELISLPSYVMAAINTESRGSSEASVKYLIYGSTSAGLFLYGASLLYGFSGSFQLDAIGMAISEADNALPYTIALLLMLVGVGFKASFFPMHMWIPDVYQGAPKAVGAFLSTAPKAAGVALLIRLGYEWAPALLEHAGYSDGMTYFFALIAIVTMTVGNFTALLQDNLKRLLGYSTIAHVGYIMMAFTLVGTASMADGFQAMIYYLFIYTIMNIGAFGILLALDREWMDELDGMVQEHPVTSVCAAVFLFSLTGLPPLAGFPAKFYLFYEVIGQTGTVFLIVAIVGALNAVVSFFYYARVLKRLFLHERDEDARTVHSPLLSRAVVGVLAVFTVGLGIYWEPLWSLTERLMVFV